MILKQLKQLTFSASLKNAVLYRSLSTTKHLTSRPPSKLSREDRKALVVSFINEYKASNGGKSPSLKTIHKEVRGSYFIVRDIVQELRLKSQTSLPIVAKALSEVSPSLPNDASSKTVKDAQSHDSKAEHLSSAVVVVDSEFPAGTDQRQTTIEDSSHPKSDDETVITATDDRSERKAALNNDVDSKLDKKASQDLNSETEKSIVIEECLKNSETEKEEDKSTHLGSQGSKVDNQKEAAVSENVVSTENRQVSEGGAGEEETEKSSSTWSSIMSFAKGFANYWRKG